MMKCCKTFERLASRCDNFLVVEEVVHYTFVGEPKLIFQKTVMSGAEPCWPIVDIPRAFVQPFIDTGPDRWMRWHIVGATKDIVLKYCSRRFDSAGLHGRILGLMPGQHL